LALKPPFSYFLVAAVLALTVQMFVVPGLGQSSASQSLLRNGDFSNGLNGWTPGTIKPSRFPGYPRWGIFNSTPWRLGTNPFAFLDVPGGAEAYLDSDPFQLPENQSGWTLQSTLWGFHDPTILQVQIKSKSGIYTLDSFEPPKVELGEQPAGKSYFIPGNFTLQTIAVRLTCQGVNPTDSHGVYCGYDDVAIVAGQRSATTPTTSPYFQSACTIPTVQWIIGFWPWIALLLIGVGLILFIFRRKLSDIHVGFGKERFANIVLFVLLLIVLNIKIWIAFQYRIGVWDGYSYLLNARRFLYGYDPYIFFEILRPPLVPYLIALTWGLAGENIYIAEALQPIFTVAGAGVLYLLLKRMFGYKPAFIAALFLLAIPEVFVNTNLILVHGEGLFFITASVYLLWRAINGKAEFYPAAAGALALATLARYTTLVFVAFFVLVLVAHFWEPVRALFRGRRRETLQPGKRVESFFWIWVAVIVFVGIWIPWLNWNYANVGGNPFASVQAGFIASIPPEVTQWYFYVANLPALLGIIGAALLVIGLADKKAFKDKARLILLLWIAVFFIFHSVIANRQTRFYIEWAPPLAAFVALGVCRLERRLPSKAKILGWALIGIWLLASFYPAVNASLCSDPFSVANQYGFIRNYDEFQQVVKWVDSNTNHMTIGATDIGPFLSYSSNRLFYDVSWIEQESNARGITMDQFMKQLGVKIIVVRSDYINVVNLYKDSNLTLLKSLPDYAIFQLT
jgi:4-amino-4-deoxy-L-arabinose transferase-like glycosyltransferase